VSSFFYTILLYNEFLKITKNSVYKSHNNKKRFVDCEPPYKIQFPKPPTKNIFGIYFILIKHNENIKSIKLKETPQYIVFIVLVNCEFIIKYYIIW
jgi:hypothetical protein